MKFLKFKEFIENLIYIYNKNHEVYRLGIDITDYHDPYHRSIRILLEELFTKDGVDWIDWYLYDKDGISGNPREDIKAWDKDKNEICSNIENLHAFLKENNYFSLKQDGDQ